MAANVGTTDAVSEYLDRVHDLYQMVQPWLREREPDAAFSERDSGLNEELTGPYEAKRLVVSVAGRPWIDFEPKGLCVVGARGRVDVHGQFGTESLVWVEEGGPAIGFRESAGGQIEAVSGQRIFPRVQEGWAWIDNGKRQLRHLDRKVFLAQVVRGLCE